MLRVNEIFHSVQGESTHAGRPCVFVRLTGCNLRCVWCDTAYAFHEGSDMEVGAVVARVEAFGCPLVEVTGGEPLLQPGVYPLMESLLDAGLTVLLETSGAIDVRLVPPAVHKIVDLKCPGSGESDRNDLRVLEHMTERDELKFVLASREDYLWAQEMIGRHGMERRPFGLLFSTVHGELAPRDVAEWIIAARLPVRFQLQQHKVHRDPTARGV